MLGRTEVGAIISGGTGVDKNGVSYWIGLDLITQAGKVKLLKEG